MTMIWLKKYITLKVEGARQRGRPRKTWKEVVDRGI